MRILVCGSRDFSDRAKLEAILDSIIDDVDVIIHGAARGADTMAGEWAAKNNIPIDPYPVTREDWEREGKRAGHLRNEKMLREGRPDLVIAFCSGPIASPGTMNMIRNTAKAGVPYFIP